MFEQYGLAVRLRREEKALGKIDFIDVAACIRHKPGLDLLVREIIANQKIDPSMIVRSLALQDAAP
jgi:hypothetical protein